MLFLQYFIWGSFIEQNLFLHHAPCKYVKNELQPPLPPLSFAVAEKVVLCEREERPGGHAHTIAAGCYGFGQMIKKAYMWVLLFKDMIMIQWVAFWTMYDNVMY